MTPTVYPTNGESRKGIAYVRVSTQEQAEQVSRSTLSRQESLRTAPQWAGPCPKSFATPARAPRRCNGLE
jgi:hypothetical protein